MIIIVEQQNKGYCESPIEIIFYERLKERLPDICIEQQVKIGKYRVDFLLPEHNIIVECDGKNYHNKQKDWERDRKLEELGYMILRFTGSEIFRELSMGKTKEEGYNILDIVETYINLGLPTRLSM